jgi:DNA-binding LacI/PurR family transcriptional regulator
MGHAPLAAQPNRFSTPALTTVHIDAEAHGRLAARTALGPDTAGLAPVPGRVIVRGSA